MTNQFPINMFGISRQSNITGTITIRKGELQKIQADILAYTISCDMDFSKGLLSSAILKAAGNTMKGLLPKNNYMSQSHYATDGCNLPCQQVFHICLKPFNGNNITDIENHMKQCLAEAEYCKVSSIAFSALGAGQLMYKDDDVSRNMLNTAQQHFAQSQNSLQEILIIIHPKDNNLFMAFKDAAKLLPYYSHIKINIEENKPTIGTPMFPDFTFGSVGIYLIQGNILNEETDAIVHCTDASFNLNGAISKCLIHRIGAGFTRDCQRLKPSMKQNHFAITSVHNLKCQYIFHVDIVSQLSVPEKILETCFLHAEQQNISSISIPHLSTCGKAIPLYKMADALAKVLSKLQSKCLKQVNVVLYDSKSLATLKNDILTVQGKTKSTLASIPPSKIFQIKPLQSHDADYQKVKTNFLSSLKRNAQIISIEKIINKTLKIQYEAQLMKIKSQNPPQIQNERILWHGTKQETVVSICKNGFDRGYCGANGTWHGQGVYFAVNSEYSDKDTYTPRDLNGHKHMLMCHVATGEYVQGTPSLKVLPIKSYGTQKYDSAVNNVSNPTVFIIFNDVQAFPGYHITYR